jgi:hypothetical protein
MDLLRRPVLADSHDLEAQALKFGHDGGFAAGKLIRIERPLLRILMPERCTDDGLGVAQFTGYRIAHEVVAGFTETVARKERCAPKPMELVECGLDGGRAL